MWFKSLLSGVWSELRSVRFRSRSHHAGHDDAGTTEAGNGGGGDALGESCWAELPPDLLRDVLARVEQEKRTWPSRKDVVACAGVCRAWRTTMTEIVGVPQASGRLTFPISLKQPGPRDTLIKCFIRRNRSAQTYQLYLGIVPAITFDGKFLLAAKRCGRPFSTDYVISLNSADMSKGSGAYIGKLSSRLLGIRFVIYESVPQHDEFIVSKRRTSHLLSTRQVSRRVPAGDYPVSHIAYEVNMLGTSGPRKMRCVMDSIPASSIEPDGVAPTPTQNVFLSIFVDTPFNRSESSLEPRLVLRNKAPRWHGQLQRWCLNFRGRVTMASVKNFQLVAAAENGQPIPEPEKVLLQFGKMGKDLFTMDYQYPLSTFQAFAICLSSFDTKVGRRNLGAGQFNRVVVQELT